MSRTLQLPRIATIFACLYYGCPMASAEGLPPANPCDIIEGVSRLVIPRLDFREPTTLQNVLAFIHQKYLDTHFIDPPREASLVFEYRMPDAILKRKVSFEARDVTMIEAFKRAFGNIPFALTFEPGKIIVSEPASPKPASRSK